MSEKVLIKGKFRHVYSDRGGEYVRMYGSKYYLKDIATILVMEKWQ